MTQDTLLLWVFGFQLVVIFILIIVIFHLLIETWEVNKAYNKNRIKNKPPRF